MVCKLHYTLPSQREFGPPSVFRGARFSSLPTKGRDQKNAFVGGYCHESSTRTLLARRVYFVTCSCSFLSHIISADVLAIITTPQVAAFSWGACASTSLTHLNSQAVRKKCRDIPLSKFISQHQSVSPWSYEVILNTSLSYEKLIFFVRKLTCPTGSASGKASEANSLPKPVKYFTKIIKGLTFLSDCK